MTAGAGGIGFCKLEAITVGVVLSVNGDKRWNTKATKVFLANLGARTLGRHHDDSNVLTHLHAFLNNVEAV